MSLREYIQKLETAQQEARMQAQKREREQAAAQDLASAKATEIRNKISAYLETNGFSRPMISSFEETRYTHQKLNKVLTLHFSTQEKFSLGVRFDGTKLGDITISQGFNEELLYKSSKYPNSAPNRDLLPTFDSLFPQ